MSAPATEVSLLGAEELQAPELRARWRELAEARSNPFITPEWCAAWLRSHPGDAPHVLAWRKGGELRGVLPLVASGKGPAKPLCFAGARRADWVTPACRAEDEAEMGRAVAAFLAAERGWHTVRFDRLDEASSWPTTPGAGGEEGALRASERRRDVLPYIAFDERGFEGYMADRSRNFRSQMGRRRRKLEGEHELAFRMTADPAELKADLDTFFRLHDERWSRRGGSSSADAATREHQRLFAAAALERGWLRLWIAEADGAPAAAWYGWRIGERYCYALAGLDQRYEDRALGTVLLGHTIEQAAAEGASIYDMMWGEEGYKERFETARRYARTWFFTRPSDPVGFGVRSAIGLAKRAEGLPPWARDPLKKISRAVRRS